MNWGIVHLIMTQRHYERCLYSPSHWDARKHLQMNVKIPCPEFQCLRLSHRTDLRISWTIQRGNFKGTEKVTSREWEQHTHTHTGCLNDWQHFILCRGRERKNRKWVKRVYLQLWSQAEREIWTGGKERRICLLNLWIIILITEEWNAEKRKATEN